MVRCLWNRLVPLKLEYTQESPRDSVRMQSQIQQVWGGAGDSASLKRPGDADAAGAWTASRAERNKWTLPRSSHRCSPVGLKSDFALESSGNFKINGCLGVPPQRFRFN